MLSIAVKPTFLGREHRISPDNLALPNFDLSVVMARVSKTHPDWSPGRLKRAETHYRRFLGLSKAVPDMEFVPALDLDIVWHHHLNDSPRYRHDCKVYFGYFLDHAPAEEGVDQAGDIHRTADMYALYFDERYPSGEYDESDTVHDE